MSVEVKIPKEINSYETKLIAGLTTRQTVCVVGIISACLFFFNIFNPICGKDITSFICIVAAAPFALAGWWKPYGMVFEQFAVTVIKSLIVAPTHYKYKTENLYEYIQEAIEKEDKRLAEIENKKNKKKVKKVKYKKSKLAIK